jgi:hypothetical protein
MKKKAFIALCVASEGFAICEIYLLANGSIGQAIAVPLGALLVATVLFIFIGLLFAAYGLAKSVPRSEIEMPGGIFYAALLTILYGLGFVLCSSVIRQEHAVLGRLARECLATDSAIPRSVYDFFDLAPEPQIRIIKAIQKDPALLSTVESSLRRFAEPGSGGDLGLFLAQLNPRYDRDFLPQSVRQCALLLDEATGEWKESKEGPRLYDVLKRFDQRLIPILTEEVKEPVGRRQILFLSVKLGISGSEESLCGALEECGDKQMAEDYLNCGSGTLAEAARLWAERRGYHVLRGQGSHRVKWGGGS